MLGWVENKIKRKLGEMRQWVDANLEDLRSRKRNDGEEEQARGCFKAKLRRMTGAVENQFYQRFRRKYFKERIEASPP